MNSKTFNKRLLTLSSEIYNHAYKDELLNIMSQQLEDDTPVMDSVIIPNPKFVYSKAVISRFTCYYSYTKFILNGTFL